MIGSAGSGAASRHEWSVDGQTLLQEVGQITIDGKVVDQAAIDSVRVSPLEAVRYFHDGMIQTLMVIDQMLGEDEGHALAVEVQTSSPRDILFAIQPARQFVVTPHHDPKSILYRKKADGSLGYSGGASGEVSAEGITVRQASKATFVIVYAPGDSADVLAQREQGEIDLLRNARRDRMEKLLQHAYLRASDRELTQALRWLQLTLDGLTIESSETTAVAALPWDGSLNARDNAIAVAGLDVATGNYAATGAILRSIARHPDKSADGGAWFVREAYEHIIASGDTMLVRELYPAVQSHISGAMKQTDAFNFLLTGNGVPKGTRTADQQGLWYYQQTIGSIFAAYLGDSSHAAQWALMADLTSSAFNRMFVDTTRSVLYERIAANGRGSVHTGAGTLLCLDMIESEVVRQNTVKSVMKALLRPNGIVVSAAPEAVADNNGAIRNWMVGQMVYALTRYDCEQISFPVTRRLADRLLTTDMIGVLPEMYDALEEGRAAGAQASLAAMAEYFRSFYQDYLGVHVNMTTHVLALEPKLPAELSDVDFTIFAGGHPLIARYERSAEHDRVVLKTDGLADSLRLSFLWMMKNGDAWRGAMALRPGGATMLVFGERDATAFYNDKEMQLESVRHLVGFSQRKEMEGL